MNQLPDHNILDLVFTAPEDVLLKDHLFFTGLSAAINDLILHNFEKLVSLLYRLDVNEKKLRQMLAQQHEVNAADTIASLVIERQLEKIKSRKDNRRDSNDINEEEKW